METLKREREKKGLLQKDVAKYLGIDRTTYVKYERGQSEPSFEILLKLAKYFSVSVDYLLGNDAGMLPNNDKPATTTDDGLNDKGLILAKKIDRLSEQSRRELENYLDYLSTKDNQPNP